MDADILRLILFLAGVGLILGIYFWDRHKRVNARIHAIRKAQQEDSEGTPLASSGRREPGWKSPAASMEESSEKGETGSRVADDDLDEEALQRELAQLNSLAHEDQVEQEERPAEVKQSAFSFTADDEEIRDELEREDVPGMILQINVVASGAPFTGNDIMRVARDTDLIHGDMNIFHRFTSEPGTSRVIFSMASMVEPGIFPLDRMDSFSTPGLVLFGQLPGPKDGLAAFSDMLFTAERLAALLDGELQDETHSVLSKQTIEHIRERILEHRRQVQLALSRS
ncbi:MAG: cell division protein ZipA [Sedimenticola sp.]|nr:cell division protein ZipA [Sedimenticola sp.]